MKNLIIAGAMSLVAHGAFAATNVASVTQLGSVLWFPFVASNGSTTDTIIRMANAAGGAVTVACHIIDKNGTATGSPFAFPLVGRGSLSFGLGASGLYPGGDGVGFMICWATDDAVNRQINFNHLTGTARVIWDDVVNGEEAGEYSAWAFAARTGANRDPVGPAGVINLNGSEFDYCPQYVLGQYSPNLTTAPTPGKGTTRFKGARFAVMPCTVDLTNPSILPLDPALTSVTLTIMNEYGVASGSPTSCIGSWHEAALPNKPSYATTNAVAFRVESNGGAYGCSQLPKMGVVGTLVETATVAGDPDRTASTLTSCGFRAGSIKWR